MFTQMPKITLKPANMKQTADSKDSVFHSMKMKNVLIQQIILSFHPNIQICITQHSSAPIQVHSGRI
jgi:hypothetical protein